MKAFTRFRGTAAPLTDQGKLMANVDTDMIIPKQFLKTTERDGLSEGLFYELKTLPDGSRNPDFVLNKPQYAEAGVLIAGDNFGCGSSREHAPWALLDQGVTCIVAPSFADIFFNNCSKNGILAVVLPADICDQLAAQAGGSNSVFEVDLEQQLIIAPDGSQHHFDIDAGSKEKISTGMDDIAMSLKDSAAIETFENKRKLAAPWLGSGQ
ncbi:MAG: 3-isopropylmalate dehydratase small subunit [Henriciella sp.]